MSCWRKCSSVFSLTKIGQSQPNLRFPKDTSRTKKFVWHQNRLVEVLQGFFETFVCSQGWKLFGDVWNDQINFVEFMKIKKDTVQQKDWHWYEIPSYDTSNLWNMQNKQTLTWWDNKRTRSGFLSFVVNKSLIYHKRSQQIWININWFSWNKCMKYKHIIKIYQEFNMWECRNKFCGLNLLIFTIYLYPCICSMKINIYRSEFAVTSFMLY